MKSKLIYQAILVCSLIFSSMANADDANNWSVGVGSYAFTLANDTNSRADYDFSGLNLAAGYAFNNHFQVRATYFTLENDEVSDIESTGHDVMVYVGVGLSEPGFRGYGGAGYFSDEWSLEGLSETYTGLQFGGGLGYNWGPAALDFVITLREAKEYEDLLYVSGTYVAMSGNLSLSLLF